MLLNLLLLTTANMTAAAAAAENWRSREHFVKTSGATFSAEAARAPAPGIIPPLALLLATLLLLEQRWETLQSWMLLLLLLVGEW